VRHGYGNYCREFKNLFEMANKEGKGKLWERASLINPWNFYALSGDKLNKIYDEFANIKDDMRVSRGLLEKMKKAFDGSEEVEGLVKYISGRNEKEPPEKSLTLSNDDNDLAPLEPEVLGVVVVGDNQIIKVYWSYGEDYTSLENKNDDGTWISRYYSDLNVHIETNAGNDGKTLKTIIEYNGQEIELSGIVFDNEVVFEKVFEKYV
jgi:hypothetical protein